MSAVLHLDLLTPQEHLSSKPVRLRVMVPLVALLALAGILVWWGLFVFRLHAAVLQKSALSTDIESLKKTHQEVLQLRADEKEHLATIQQFALYRHSQLRFGDIFKQLADCVPGTMQLTELRIPLPPPPLMPVVPKGGQVLGPTNKTESVTLKLAGRASGEHPSLSVKMLLDTISTPSFSNLIQRAEIPKGAFRQDTIRGASKQDSLLFEINCECTPRRFE